MADRRTPARDIAEQLRAAISAGDYAPGDRLPSRAELKARHGVATATVLAAIDQLRAEGLVESVTGSGVYVRRQPRVMRSARSRLSRAERDAGRGAFTTDAHEGGWQASAEVVVRTEPASELVAGQLQISPGEQVFVRSRVMRADGVVVQLATSYLPHEVTTPAMAEPDTGPGGLYARLEETGLILTRFEETVRLGQADPGEAAALEVEPGTTVLRLVRVASTEDQPVEVNHITMLGDRFELYYDIPAR